MGNIFTPLPYHVREKGRIYTLTPQFDNVLQMYQAIENLDSWDKPEVMLSYLVKQKVKPSLGLLKAVSDVLFTPSKGSGDKAFDFVQDSPLIYAAFYQAYGMDLVDQQGKLHWWKFQSLLNGLPSNTRFSEIVSIRMKPIPAPTKYNQEEREELMRLKAVYALNLTSKEREEQLQRSLWNVVKYLQSVAKGK